MALLPLTVHTKSLRFIRAPCLFLLIFICIGINTTIELTIFSTYFVNGGAFFLAILAFPVIYFVFGSMVTPFVVGFYRSGASPFVLPPISKIIPVQFLRSSLFLLASAPFLFLWTRSRASLIFSLGLAHWYLVGLFGLIQVMWLPPVVRIEHSMEIGLDSFIYVAGLVLLLVPRHRESAVSTPTQVAPMFPS